MNPDDVSLFIGRLPGDESRKLVLFPGGRVVAEICEREVKTPSGEERPDRGANAAAALISALNGCGWYIDQMDKPSIVWLKPSSSAEPGADIAIDSVNVDLRAEGPKASEGAL